MVTTIKRKLLHVFVLIQMLLFFTGIMQSFSQSTTTLNKDTIIVRKQRILNFLGYISGKQTLAGQHNERFDSIHQFERTEAVYKATGKYPALFGIDFSYDYRIYGRWKMIYEAEKQFDKGALINVMWHACIPTLQEPCIRNKGIETKMTDDLWNQLLTDGTPLNKEWIRRLDTVAVYLDYLQNKGVVVLWRPLHEMNQGVFWWGGRPGAQGTLRLYQIIHDYFTNVKKLNNLIWVWDIQDFETLKSDVFNYNPGNKYWDVLALDYYSGTMYTPEKYKIITKAAGAKPIAIGECAKIPSPQVLASQPRWTFFMAWADLIFKENPMQLIKDIYADPAIVTLDKMPGWASGNSLK